MPTKKLTVETLTPKQIGSLLVTGVDTKEAETLISYMREGNDMIITTSDNTQITRFRKLVLSNPKDWKVTKLMYAQKDLVAVEFTGNKDLLTVREKKVVRELTDEQRAAAADRMSALHAKKSQKESE